MHLTIHILVAQPPTVNPASGPGLLACLVHVAILPLPRQPRGSRPWSGPPGLPRRRPCRRSSAQFAFAATSREFEFVAAMLLCGAAFQAADPLSSGSGRPGGRLQLRFMGLRRALGHPAALSRHRFAPRLDERVRLHPHRRLGARQKSENRGPASKLRRSGREPTAQAVGNDARADKPPEGAKDAAAEILRPKRRQPKTEAGHRNPQAPKIRAETRKNGLI